MKLDPVLTRKVQEWLNAPEHERDIKEGATLMLQLNRNRALYNSIMLRPEKFKDKLVYELKKYLRIRLDNITVSEVADMEAEVMPRVRETVESLSAAPAPAPDSEPVISSDSEFSPSRSVPKGKRPDHDSLPAHIRELWDSNEERYRSIVLLFNELKGMAAAQPCDRYEKLKILDETERKYRSNLREYDEYVAGSENTGSGGDGSGSIRDSDIVRAVGAARKTISKYKRVIAADPEDAERVAAARLKIQSAVSVIRNAGAEFSEATVKELSPFGIKFD